MGDLFSRTEEQPLTVSQVNARARVLLERNFATVTLVGEVSGHKVVSGHHYFSLKDKDSQLGAVFFRREAMVQKVELVDGMEVLATGKLTIYSAYGRYQFVVERLQNRGAGALQVAFEQLKARLNAEGLFALERKRHLPLLPKRVVVVTSPTGAVIRDIAHVARRRFPAARLLVMPTRVQGEDAAPLVAAAIRKASALAPRLGLEVIIVARGGGSLEDLWCFNDERVARAIYEAAVPVVSAIGHETDFTIADFVADVRAPTPSAAAELVFPVRAELLALLSAQLARARAALARQLGNGRMHLRALRAELGDTRRLVREPQQRLSQARLRQIEALKRLLLDRRLELRGLEGRLLRLHPRAHLTDVRSAFHAAKRRIALAVRQSIVARRHRLTALDAQLRALSPLGALDRGYAIVQNADGRVVRRYDEIGVGDAVAIRLAHGGVDAEVRTTRPPGTGGSI